MTTTDYEATRLFVTAEEEDAERDEDYYNQVVSVLTSVVVAPGHAEETPPFDNQLKGLPDDDEIVQILNPRDADLPRAKCGHRRRYRYQGQDGCLCCDLEAQRGRVTV